MPVSVVCESSANVSAALRESLGVGSCSSAADDAKAAGTSAKAAATLNGNNSDGGGGDDCFDNLHSKLAASAKRVLLTKLEYEEVPNYSQSVLENFKSKYIILKSDSKNNGSNMENGRASSPENNNANGNNNNNKDNGKGDVNGINGSTADTNANSNRNNNNNNNATISAANINNNNISCNNNNNIKRANPNELPQPKRVLFPRESVRIGWKSSQRKWQIGVGMMNVGNTCYLNSTLQAIFHVPSMANWLLYDTQHMERCDSADAGCIICAMAKTLQASQSSQSAIRPHFVYTKLKSICKHLVLGRQEDAHEFLRYLMEAMEKSYLSRFRNHKELDQYSKETTPLNQILGGYLKSAVQCLSCNHVSVTFQHFQDLLLDIRKADTIEEALDGYFSRERLEDMGYKCESCKKKVSATKQFLLERAPIALCIQLKRFSMLGTKINKQITIKPRLDLTKFASRKNSSEQLTYRLVAMVTHLGASQHCGHYTAIGLTESGTYYNYDDSYVRPVSMQNVCNTNAYIIFYEMDNTPVRQVSSTQVSASATQQNNINSGGFASAKETYQKLNGYATHTPPQRIIGPQLPPMGLSSYTAKPATSITTTATTSSSGGGTNTTALYSNGSKVSINRQSTIPTSSSNNNSNSNNNTNNNSKIMIHFKSNNNNNNNNNNATVKSSACSSITTATATSSSQNGNNHYQNNNNNNNNNSNGNSNNNNNNNTHFQQNGLLTGTGKFQESTYPKSTLAGTSNKGQAATISNGNESSCSSDHEDEVSSSTQMARKQMSNNVCSSSTNSNVRSTLPSMPKLFENTTQNAIHGGNNGSNGSAGKRSTNTMAATFSKGPLKSLVPYEFETDDDDASTESKRLKCTPTSTEKHTMNPLKRRGSLSSSCDSESADEYDDSADFKRNVKPANGVKIKRAGTSNSSNYSTFNGNSSSYYSATSTSAPASSSSSSSQSKAKQKTDAIDEIFNSLSKRNANSNNNGVSNNTVTTTPPIKKHKSQYIVSSTTPTTDSDDNVEEEDVRPPFQRSHSTPPSPPVIKTKTGLWQVTTLKPVTANISPPEQRKIPKNPKNPFATKTPDVNNAKRNKLNGEKSDKRSLTFAGNGYQRDTASDSAVSELLKQSHRGYGAPVLTWKGDQTDIEKEIKEETRAQRQRDWEEEEENEMDRGRQKKVKSHKDSHNNNNNNNNNRTPGYNPFQMEQENQRRWRHGGGRSHGGHFRNQFQRNKFKFQRFNHKYQQRAHNNYNRRDS